jgi:hypothetical protein
MTRAISSVPGTLKTLSDCSLTLAVFGGIITALVLSLASAGILGIQFPAPVWWVLCVISIGPLVASIVGIHQAPTVPIDDPVFTPKWYHSSNYNESSAVSSYVDRANAYHHWNVTRPRKQAGPSDGQDVWSACGYPDAFFALLASEPVGTSDLDFQFDFAYSSPSTGPPWTTNKSFSWESYPAWDDLYASSYTTACYGTSWDKSSITRAKETKDMCALKLATVEGCAPGWGKALFQDEYCAYFKLCVADYQEKTTRWAKIGAVNITEPGGSQRFQLPVNWNDMDKFESLVKSEQRSNAATSLIISPLYWVSFHAPLFAIEIAGWVLLVAGMAYWSCVSEKDKGLGDMGLIKSSLYS